MYGLVNKAIQGLIETEYDSHVWTEIRTKAGVTDEQFLCMKTYDDRITYDLVGAASEVLGKSGDEILVAFGQYWTKFSAKEGYGDLLESIGDDLPTVLSQLDDMHTRLGLSFPELRPPFFSCSTLSDSSLRLLYRSERKGLSSFVVGLVQGLAAVLDVKVNIELVDSSEDGRFVQYEYLIQYESNKERRH